MKRFMPVLLFLLLGASSEAQIRWGARLGVVDGEPMIGADAILRIASHFYFNPNVELSGYGFTTNADAHYDIEIQRDAALFFGAGIALVNPENQDLDVGVNLLAGLATRRGRYILYSQLKRTAPADADSVNSVAVGIRF
jgi:hypothetical protein